MSGGIMEKVQETITSSGRICKDEELPSTKTWGLADKRTRKSAFSKRQASFTGNEMTFAKASSYPRFVALAFRSSQFGKKTKIVFIFCFTQQDERQFAHMIVSPNRAFAVWDFLL